MRARVVAGALTAGVLTGLVLTLAHGLLPDRWAVLAGTSALWGVVPMLLGRRSATGPVGGAVVGVLAMAGTLTPWMAVHSGSTSVAEMTMWSVVGPVAGAVCGAAGALSSRPGGRGAIAAAVVPGIVAGEAVYGLVVVGGPAWGLELVIAAGLLVGVSRPGSRITTVGSALVVLGLVAVACLGYDAVLA